MFWMAAGAVISSIVAIVAFTQPEDWPSGPPRVAAMTQDEPPVDPVSEPVAGLAEPVPDPIAAPVAKHVEAAEPAGDPAPAGGDEYQQLVAEAQRASDTDCLAAMPLYRKALVLEPRGVEAMSGLGYCHLDERQFATARSRFRAAISISPRYEPALWGLAEAYQVQGRNPEAIDAYLEYLAVFPGSEKATRALARLRN